jgi:hypothetical protein
LQRARCRGDMWSRWHWAMRNALEFYDFITYAFFAAQM